MASIVLDTVVRAPPDVVWRGLADIGAAHRVFSPVLTGCRADGDGARIATFANGLEVTERIISVDAERQRIAYTVVSGGFEHHGASMEVVAENASTCRFVWIADVLPHAAADRIRPLMEAGAAALRKTFEAG